MSAAYLLDSNICIYILESNSRKAVEKIQSVPRSELCVSSVVYAEVMLGMELTDQAELGRQFFKKFAILPFDEKAAGQYARLPFRRGSFDRLIAAHALSQGLTLITNNEADFADIQGLKLENWTI